MEAFVVLIAGLIAGGCLVGFFQPRTFVRQSSDGSRRPATYLRWLFLALFFLMLGSGLKMAASVAGVSGPLSLAVHGLCIVAGIAATARMIREKRRLMRERHAGELSEL